MKYIVGFSILLIGGLLLGISQKNPKMPDVILPTDKMSVTSASSSNGNQEELVSQCSSIKFSIASELNPSVLKPHLRVFLDSIIKVTALDGFSVPKWSPDGEKLIFTTAAFVGLYLLETSNPQDIKVLNTIPGAGYNASWLSDSKRVCFRNKELDQHGLGNLEVKCIDIESMKIQNAPSMNPDGLASNCSAKLPSDPIVYTNTKTLQIEAHTLDKARKWNITNQPGQFYEAILSPDKKSVVVHEGNEMFIYATDGSGQTRSLGNGIATSWSPDGKHLLFFLATDNGHEITGSDLFLCEVADGHRWQLTQTREIFEMYPSFSPDGGTIAYSDENKGAIYTAKLNGI